MSPVTEKMIVRDETGGRARRYGPWLASVAMVASLAASPPGDEKGDSARVEGLVVTHDGSPLPDDLEVRLISRSPRGSSSYSTSVERGRFSLPRVAPGAVYVWARSRAGAFAPRLAGPFEAEPGGSLTAVKVELRPGFRGEILVADAAGRPLPGAELEVKHIAPWGMHFPLGALKSDQRGLAVIENCPDLPLEIEIVRRGYEFEIREDVRLRRGRRRTFRMTPAFPTRGRIVARGSGTGAAGAVLRLAQRSKPFSASYGPDSGPVLARSDGSGSFVLNTLRRDTEYVLIVEAPGRERKLLNGIRAGQRGLRVELGPEILVRGRIAGPLAKLAKRRGRPVVIVYQNVKFGDTSHGWSRRVEVEPDTARFEIHDLFPGRLRIHAGGKRVELDPKGAVTDLVIDLSQEDSPSAPRTRKVRIRFTVPEGRPAVSGTISVRSFADDPSRSPKFEDLVIEAGAVTFDAHVPGRIVCIARRTIGYFFDDAEARVDEGRQPLELDIATQPAGVIRGQVLNPDGTKASAYHHINCYCTTDSKLNRLNFSADANGEFLITPLRLGEEYIVAVSRGKNIQVSEKIVVDSKRPTRRIVVRRVKGVDLEARVVDDKGKPLAGVPVTVGLEHPVVGTSYSPAERSDRKGRVIVRDVNPDLGRFRLQIRPRRDFQPANADLPMARDPVTIRLQRGQVVEGKVVDAATDRPLPDVEVYATPVERSSGVARYDAESKTDAQGRFRFSTLPGEACRIRVRSGVRPVEPYEVQPGDRAKIEIRVTVPSR